MTKTAGYITDVPYTLSFYKEMQPAWLCTVAQLQGFKAPDLSNSFSYCELGCGNGINLLLAAACNPQGHFTGVDINPQHIAYATEQARQLALSNVRFIQSDFASFAGQDTQKFDFIVCHGTWSWIADSDKQHILTLLSQQLKPLGLCYLHYMCYPASGRMHSVQKLLHQQAGLVSGSSTDKMHSALALLTQMLKGGAFTDNPALQQYLSALLNMPANYLAHDLLSDHWQPEHSTNVHQRLNTAGLAYIGSADVFNNLTELSIPGDLQPVLSTVADPLLREQIKDMARDAHQRTDIFQYRSTPLTASEHIQALNRIQLAALPGATATEQHFNTPIGSISAPAELTAPIMQRCMAQPVSIATLRALAEFNGQTALLLQLIQMLMWQQCLHPVLPVQISTASRSGVQQWLNTDIAALQLCPLTGAVRTENTLKTILSETT